MHSVIDSTAHTRPLNSLEHCIYMHNLNGKYPSGRSSSPVNFVQQPERKIVKRLESQRGPSPPGVDVNIASEFMVTPKL